jgi:hypothetical protein
MATDTILDLTTAELLPSSKIADGTTPGIVATRGNGYREPFVLSPIPTTHLLAAEGSYFVATPTTPGTAVAYGSAGTQASYSDTTAFCVVQNTAAAGSGRKLFLHYLKILVSGTVPASATSTQFSVTIDNANRAPTANATLLAAAAGTVGGVSCPNLSAAQPPVNVWVPNAQVPTVPASGAQAHIVARGSLRQSISVTLDEYVLHFGGPDGPGANSSASVGRFVGSAPPVCLNPQEYCVIKIWQPSAVTNPLTCEIELTGWVR